MARDISQFVRKNILDLAPYSSAREEYTGKAGVFLDANENPYGIYNRYPDPYQLKVKEALSEVKGIAKEKIFIGNGSDEVIDIAFRVFCEPNRDKALTFSPTYGMYEVSAAINAVELVKIPLNTHFQIDREAVSLHFSDVKLKLIFICSPNNPTGNLIDVEDIAFILENFNGMVIVDEAYIDFCEQASFLHQLDKYANLIVCQTMSKAWGLAGVRLGVAYMNELALHFYNKVKAPYNISVLNQEAALEALRNFEDYEKVKNEILQYKAELIVELKKIKAIVKIYPSDANFLLVEVKKASELYRQLIEKKIVIRNRDTVIPNCVRITVGTREENNSLVQELLQLEL